MVTISIPKKMAAGDLIIISRKELGRLLSLAQKNPGQKNLQVLALEAKARKNLVGPFTNTKDLFKSLGI